MSDAATKTEERYPKGAIDQAIIALEAARPDTKEGRAVRGAVDEALRRLYRARELHEARAGSVVGGSGEETNA